MIRSKICGVSDQETLKYIINHKYHPQFVGFICNYNKSKRYVEFDKLVKLIDLDKKNISFVAVLVNPNDLFLEKIKTKSLSVTSGVIGFILPSELFFDDGRVKRIKPTWTK